MPFPVKISGLTKYCGSCSSMLSFYFLFKIYNLKGDGFIACISKVNFLYWQDLPTDVKKRNDFKKMCISSIASECPEDCKFHPADTKDELHKVDKHRFFVFWLLIYILFWSYIHFSWFIFAVYVAF